MTLAVAEIKRCVSGASFNKLLEDVYTAYPKYAATACSVRDCRRSGEVPRRVVLATDSQGTARMPGGYPVKQYAKKVERLTKNVVYGGTGGQGAGQRIHAVLWRRRQRWRRTSPLPTAGG